MFTFFYFEIFKNCVLVYNSIISVTNKDNISYNVLLQSVGMFHLFLYISTDLFIYFLLCFTLACVSTIDLALFENIYPLV